MSTVNQLKNKARREEQRENWSRAIEYYTKALDSSRAEDETFADLSLYNRIGDIYLRIGQKNTAVWYYEQAIERYSEQDLHTSAIALCNKVLRVLPERSTVFLQLGRLHLATSLIADARMYFHRYATSMRERGGATAGYEALEELIGLTGDQPTLSLWMSWLSAETDPFASDRRVELAREALEGQGLDPAEVIERVRTGDATDLEVGPAAAAQVDSLAGAFLSVPDGYTSADKTTLIDPPVDEAEDASPPAEDVELESVLKPEEAAEDAALEGMLTLLPDDLELGSLQWHGEAEEYSVSVPPPSQIGAQETADVEQLEEQVFEAEADPPFSVPTEDIEFGAEGYWALDLAEPLGLEGLEPSDTETVEPVPPALEPREVDMDVGSTFDASIEIEADEPPTTRPHEPATEMAATSLESVETDEPPTTRGHEPATETWPQPMWPSPLWRVSKPTRRRTPDASGVKDIHPRIRKRRRRSHATPTSRRPPRSSWNPLQVLARPLNWTSRNRPNRALPRWSLRMRAEVRHSIRTKSRW